MRKVKTLYKTALEIFFHKSYYCVYCEMIDFNKYFIRNHIKECHDEYGREIRKYTCKTCYESITEIEILSHNCLNSN